MRSSRTHQAPPVEQGQLFFADVLEWFAEKKVGLCCCQTCLVLAVPLRKKLAPLNVRIFHLPSVVMELTISR